MIGRIMSGNWRRVRHWSAVSSGEEIMRASSDHILTSHAGSLPRPDALIEANRARDAGEPTDEHAFQQTLRKAVVDAVRHQQELGIDVPGDGEFGKSVGNRVNYGAWWSYSFTRLGGLKVTGLGLYDFPVRRSSPGNVVLSSFGDRRDARVRRYADGVAERAVLEESVVVVRELLRVAPVEVHRPDDAPLIFR